jgi:hypothetical protein
VVDGKPKSRHVELDVSVSALSHLRARSSRLLVSPSVVSIYPNLFSASPTAFPTVLLVLYTESLLFTCHPKSILLSLNNMRCPCICAGGRRRRPTFHTLTTPQLSTRQERQTYSQCSTDTMQVALPHLLQRTLGRLPTVDPR